MSWRFALRPKWIVRHVLVVVLCGVMIALGLWQLRRADEKRAFRDLVQDRQEQPAVGVDELVPTSAPDDVVQDVLQRRVTATGAYVTEDTFVVENRSLNGAAGAWVLTPLLLDDGSAVVVNRGFVGFDATGAIVPPPAPSGDVTVEGIVQPTQERGRFGPTDPGEGTLTVLARVDLRRFAAQVDYAVRPAYVQLVSSLPAEPGPRGEAPALVSLGAPEPDLGPHLSYAAQWGIFTLIAAGGYATLLRHVAREQAREEALGDAEHA